ncbi:MAG: hypothetical protein V3W41_21270 [Planctomycetota bacterium]
MTPVSPEPKGSETLSCFENPQDEGLSAAFRTHAEASRHLNSVSGGHEFETLEAEERFFDEALDRLAKSRVCFRLPNGNRAALHLWDRESKSGDKPRSPEVFIELVNPDNPDFAYPLFSLDDARALFQACRACNLDLSSSDPFDLDEYLSEGRAIGDVLPEGFEAEAHKAPVGGPHFSSHVDPGIAAVFTSHQVAFAEFVDLTSGEDWDDEAIDAKFGEAHRFRPSFVVGRDVIDEWEISVELEMHQERMEDAPLPMISIGGTNLSLQAVNNLVAGLCACGIVVDGTARASQ